MFPVLPSLPALVVCVCVCVRAGGCWWVLLVHSVDIRKSQYLPKRVSPWWEFSKSRTWPCQETGGNHYSPEANDLQRELGGGRKWGVLCTIVLTHSEEYLLKWKRALSLSLYSRLQTPESPLLTCQGSNSINFPISPKRKRRNIRSSQFRGTLRSGVTDLCHFLLH